MSRTHMQPFLTAKFPTFATRPTLDTSVPKSLPRSQILSVLGVRPHSSTLTARTGRNTASACAFHPLSASLARADHGHYHHVHGTAPLSARARDRARFTSSKFGNEPGFALRRRTRRNLAVSDMLVRAPACSRWAYGIALIL